MKNKGLYLPFLVFLFLTNILQAQNVFSPGYYIAADGTKKEGFIKNKGWKNNPNGINFKETHDGKTIKYDLEDISEFGIKDVCKYMKARVAVSKSYDIGGTLDTELPPRYDTLTVLLKVILEGAVDLYGYRVDSKQNFYYKKDGSIQTLVYKKFQTGNKLKENLQYQQQIKNELNFAIQNSDEIDYAEKSLKQLFVSNFEKKGLNYQSPNLKKELSNKAVKIQLGVDRGFMDLMNIGFLTPRGEFIPRRTRNFESTTNLRFGLEFIHTFPFNNRKWEMMLGTMYQSYKAESIEPNDASINFASQELLIGFRYRSFFNSNLSIDLSSYFIYDLPLTNSFVVGGQMFEIRGSANFEFAVGLTFKNLYSLELRAGSNRNLLNGVNITYSTNFRNISLIFGYRFGIKKLG